MLSEFVGNFKKFDASITSAKEDFELPGALTMGAVSFLACLERSGRHSKKI